jgi:enamine deaminase RidA (YjgF/YER057c/UK114 family)
MRAQGRHTTVKVLPKYSFPPQCLVQQRMYWPNNLPDDPALEAALVQFRSGSDAQENRYGCPSAVTVVRDCSWKGGAAFEARYVTLASGCMRIIDSSVQGRGASISDQRQCHAVLIERARSCDLYIAFASSVNPNGYALFTRDISAQVRNTLANVEQVLYRHGFSWKDLQETSCFCRDLETIEAFRRIAPEFSDQLSFGNILIGDIWHPELAFSMDVTAIRAS